MKATGIVRRIDDLGRVVIPKEIRRTLRIREGDPLEIFTDREGEIILKKYSPIGELGTFAKEYAESLAQTVGHITCIVDKDQIIAVSGGGKKEFFEKHISSEMEDCINKRTSLIAERNDANFVPVLEDDSESAYNHQLIVPIIAEGDAMGAIFSFPRIRRWARWKASWRRRQQAFWGSRWSSKRSKPWVLTS